MSPAAQRYLEQMQRAIGINAPKLLEVSVHAVVRGKPVKHEDKTLWCGDDQVNLGYDWHNISVSVDDLFELLTKDGMALGPALSKGTHRIEPNFKCHSVALVDIDSGMSIAELKKNIFYQKYGAGYYTTPSHTDSEPRFRIVYELEQAITDALEMRALYEALMCIHGAADASCKDASRLFYGTVNAARCERTGRVLDAAGIKYALLQRPTAPARHVRTAEEKSFPAPQLAEVQELLDELRKYVGDLQYHDRFSVTRAVATAIPAHQACAEMRSRWSDAEKTASYEEILKAPLVGNGPTLGSLVYRIRESNPQYRKAQEDSTKQLLNKAFGKSTKISRIAF
ncbi:hypothetical protein QTI05_24200 [Variovorax sp. J22R193]|uniref:hypothetical protein n=1 Tax=Variovorax fucosicus TaxID=3053517 RepID=UPI00257616A4|nr:hypothetical protein [Variovorax sp. J22R193]MDM0042162.1 hypothetical protein [Variovorax sp. J22R193]